MNSNSQADKSIIITAFREAATIGRAISAILPQITSPTFEVIVICPDDATADVAASFHGVRVLRDPQRGKPLALQIAIEAAVGALVIMTDGDVYLGDGAISALIALFSDEGVGAVSGRPRSLSSRDTILGYWSHLLTDAGAHQERLFLDQEEKFFVCSGYLYAVRKELLDPIPAEVLAEDAVISQMIGEKGYLTRYVPEAEVFVRYPKTYADWLKQKVRSAGGYAQPIIADSPLRMRSFRHEIISGTWRALRYARNPREFLWTILLFMARIHLWLLIFWRVKVKKDPLASLWKRVDSTK